MTILIYIYIHLFLLLFIFKEWLLPISFSATHFAPTRPLTLATNSLIIAKLCWKFHSPFCLCVCSTGVWTQSLHLEPLNQPFYVKDFLEIESRKLLAQASLDLNPPDFCPLSSEGYMGDGGQRIASSRLAWCLAFHSPHIWAPRNILLFACFIFCSSRIEPCSLCLPGKYALPLGYIPSHQGTFDSWPSFL
jgi:hypothetical protein